MRSIDHGPLRRGDCGALEVGGASRSQRRRDDQLRGRWRSGGAGPPPDQLDRQHARDVGAGRCRRSRRPFGSSATTRAATAPRQCRADPYTLDQLGTDALAILDDGRATSAHVCGISLGGITAQWLGLNAPRSREESGACQHGCAHRYGRVVDRADQPRASEGHVSGRRPGDGALVHAGVSRARSGNGSRLQDDGPELPAGWLPWMLCRAARCGSARLDFEHHRPTLLIASSADTATPPEGLDFIHERVNRSELVTLDSAHLSNVECAEEFTDAVLWIPETALTRRPPEDGSH